MITDTNKLRYPILLDKDLMDEAAIAADAAGIDRDDLVSNAIEMHLNHRMNLPEFPANLARQEERHKLAYRRLLERVPSG